MGTGLMAKDARRYVQHFTDDLDFLYEELEHLHDQLGEGAQLGKARLETAAEYIGKAIDELEKIRL